MCLLLAAFTVTALGSCSEHASPDAASLAAVQDRKAKLPEPCFFAAGPLNDKDSELFAAAGAGNVVQVQKMLETGANVNSADALGRTPLFSAAFCHQAQVATLLLDRGGIADARDFTGMTPLHVAVVAGASEVAKLLLEKGALINIQTSSGRTPLHLAAATDQLGLAELLLERGADSRLRDMNGATAVSIASDNSHPKIATAIRKWLAAQKALPHSEADRSLGFGGGK